MARLWSAAHPLDGNPQAFRTDEQGQVALTYTVPASPPTSGSDVLTAASDASAQPAVQATSAYP